LTYQEYSTTHAGLGVWDITTGDKFSIEFVAVNYTGALFPMITDDNQIIWNNAAKVVVTNPLVQNNWVNSRLIGEYKRVPCLVHFNYIIGI
jgi:hypothetical protein